MINLSTPPQELINTMIDELPSEMYFFRKKYGGKHKYEKFEDELLDKALAEKKSQTTDINAHISRSGNRWMTYTHVEYYPKAQYACPFHFSFIYYETFGSCGAYFPVYMPCENNRKKNKPIGVTIYTSHFFLRMSSRSGKEYRSKELIKEFVSTQTALPTQADDDDVIVKFQGGYGFGKVKSLEPLVYEIRTYLSDKELNKSQRRKVEMVDAINELRIKDGKWNPNVAFHEAMLSEKTLEEKIEDADRQLTLAKKIGIDGYYLLFMSITASLFIMIEEILNVQLTEKQQLVITRKTGAVLGELAAKYMDYDEDEATPEQRGSFEDDFTEALVKCGKKLKLKGLSRDAIVAWVEKKKQLSETLLN